MDDHQLTQHIGRLVDADQYGELTDLIDLDVTLCRVVCPLVLRLNPSKFNVRCTGIDAGIRSGMDRFFSAINGCEHMIDDGISRLWVGFVFMVCYKRDRTNVIRKMVNMGFKSINMLLLGCVKFLAAAEYEYEEEMSDVMSPFTNFTRSPRASLISPHSTVPLVRPDIVVDWKKAMIATIENEIGAQPNHPLLPAPLLEVIEEYFFDEYGDALNSWTDSDEFGSMTDPSPFLLHCVEATPPSIYLSLTVSMYREDLKEMLSTRLTCDSHRRWAVAWIHLAVSFTSRRPPADTSRHHGHPTDAHILECLQVIFDHVTASYGDLSELGLSCGFGYYLACIPVWRRSTLSVYEESVEQILGKAR
eukprot:GHVN01010464.1.p1 GENE.GHVN01010464.1~~GHVN01010464.1.p1  ORF type:complete len:361 (-),score=80.23 GHVN01010464.1:258-1340(-)